MHELAIAESIVQIVTREMERGGYARIVTVGVRIGGLSAIVPESLEFGFDAITRGTPLEGSKLVMETVAITARCRACHEAFPVERFEFVCPRCGGRDSSVVRGNELDITYLEVDDDTAPCCPPNGKERQSRPENCP